MSPALADSPPEPLTPPTRLDPSETTPQDDPVSLCFNPPYAPEHPTPTFRHRSWQRRRLSVAAALEQAAVSHRRRSAFALCGCQVWILRQAAEPENYRVVPDFCHDRWCVPCANARAARISANLLEHLEHRPVRFLTLTLAASPDPLRVRVDRLLAAFAKLRRRTFWRQRVSGGAAFLEVTRGQDGGHWHPHLHVLLDGKYLPKQEVVAAWLDITADSYVVDITLVRDRRLVAKYVVKYAAKPLDHKLHHDRDALVEAITALRGRKLLYAFGTWAKWKLLAPPTATGWTYYAHINELMYRATNGDELADLILTALQHSPHLFAGDVFTVTLDPEPPP